VGREVQIEGRAANAKLGAAVVAADLTVFCLDRAEWPDDLAGTVVRVRGVLERTAEFATATGPDGAVSTGTAEPVYVLRTSTLVRP
jgi:hypothetical protein